MEEEVKMANWIEKKLPEKVRKKLATLIVTALALFLSLQYNETMVAIFDKIYPLDSGTIFARLVYIAVLTILVVAAIIFIEKSLDGK